METAGLAFRQRKGDCTFIRVDPNMRFTGRGLCRTVAQLEARYPAGVHAVIAKERLSIEVIGMERPTQGDLGLLSRCFVPTLPEDTLGEPRPLFVFRRHGEVAFDPDSELTTAHLAAYVHRKMASRQLDAGWSASLTEDFLTVQIGEWTISERLLKQLFAPLFASTCTISATAYADQKGEHRWIELKVEAGYKAKFDLAVPQKLGFRDVRYVKPDKALGIISGHPPLDELVQKAVLFAQSMGCMPIGEFTLHLGPRDRHIRMLGPVGVEHEPK